MSSRSIFLERQLRKKRILVLVGAVLLLGLVALLAASCGGTSSGTTATTAGTGTTAGSGTTAATSPTTAGTGTTAAGGGGGAQVTLQNIAISPTSVTIKVGDTVTWTNKDSFDHHLVGDNGEFDSGNMAAGATFSFQFKAAGTVNYHCTIHPEMKGTVVVQ